MPFDEYVWVDHRQILTFEEISRIASVFVKLGVNKIRLTGGEPLLRHDLEILIKQLSELKKDGLEDICLTTNGSVLSQKVAAFKSAGLDRVNVSIDSLNPEKFKQITKRGDLNKVLDGLFVAKEHGLHPIKINAVIERGLNDDDVLDLVEFSRKHGFGIRFIEYMDVGNSNNWKSERLVSKKEIIEKIGARYPLKEVGRSHGTAPSVDYEFGDGIGDLGVIASVTEPFCSSCTRARMTAEGKLVTCLFSNEGHDLKSMMRNGCSDEDLKNVISQVWHNRSDRYSDERLQAMNSPEGYQATDHKKIEMIRLGG